MSEFSRDHRGFWVGVPPSEPHSNPPTRRTLQENVDVLNHHPKDRAAPGHLHSKSSRVSKNSRLTKNSRSPKKHPVGRGARFASTTTNTTAIANDDDDSINVVYDNNGRELLVYDDVVMAQLVQAVGDAALVLRSDLKSKGVVVSDEIAVQCATQLVTHRRDVDCRRQLHVLELNKNHTNNK